MKISRKLISMLLSIAMLLSLVPSVTFAAERTVEASGLLYRIQGASSRTLTTDATPGTSGEVPIGALNPVKWILYSDGELDFELIGENTVSIIAERLLIGEITKQKSRRLYSPRVLHQSAEQCSMRTLQI